MLTPLGWMLVGSVLTFVIQGATELLRLWRHARKLRELEAYERAARLALEAELAAELVDNSSRSVFLSTE